MEFNLNPLYDKVNSNVSSIKYCRRSRYYYILNILSSKLETAKQRISMPTSRSIQDVYVCACAPEIIIRLLGGELIYFLKTRHFRMHYSIKTLQSWTKFYYKYSLCMQYEAH